MPASSVTRRSTAQPVPRPSAARAAWSARRQSARSTTDLNGASTRTLTRLGRGASGWLAARATLAGEQALDQLADSAEIGLAAQLGG